MWVLVIVEEKYVKYFNYVSFTDRYFSLSQSHLDFQTPQWPMKIMMHDNSHLKPCRQNPVGDGWQMLHPQPWYHKTLVVIELVRALIYVFYEGITWKEIFREKKSVKFIQIQGLREFYESCEYESVKLFKTLIKEHMYIQMKNQGFSWLRIGLGGSKHDRMHFPVNSDNLMNKMYIMLE